jgi:hypothetical protein
MKGLNKKEDQFSHSSAWIGASFPPVTKRKPVRKFTLVAAGWALGLLEDQLPRTVMLDSAKNKLSFGSFGCLRDIAGLPIEYRLRFDVKDEFI